MMLLKLSYWDLSSAATNANKLANELSQYCDDLTRKVQNKIYSVEGGSSSALNNANYYINNKLKQLRQKESNARTFVRNVDNLISTAKRVDQDVARTIENRQKELFKKNPDLKPPEYKAKLTKFLCDLKKVPLIGALIKGGEKIADAVETLKKDIKYWYKCEGGKELVGVVLSTVGAALAVVVAVCAITFTGGTVLAVIAGVAGAITAIIGVVNAATNIATSAMAYEAALGGHPGVAKIYAKQDTLSDFLKETNFHNKEWNRGSMIAAASIDIVDTVCSVVTFVTGGIKLIQKLGKINIAQTFRAMGMNRSTLGTFVQGKPTFWNGVKSLVMKFNIKDLVLGDLNVKDLTRFDLLSYENKFSAIGSLAKAFKGIIGDFDKINEGDMSFTEFIAKRVVTGIDQSIFGQQKLATVDGERKFYDTNFTTISKTVKQAIEAIGVGKLCNDAWGNKSIENIFGLKDGKWKDIIDIYDDFKDIKKYAGDLPLTNIPIIGIPALTLFPAYNIIPESFIRIIKPTYPRGFDMSQIFIRPSKTTLVEALIPKSFIGPTGIVIPSIHKIGHFVVPNIKFKFNIKVKMPYLNIA